jgi:cell division protein FtsI (penicillin-binding protein 3)
MVEQKRRTDVHVPQGFEVPKPIGHSGTTFLDSNQFRALEVRRKRLFVVGAFFALAYVVMAFRLLDLTVIHGETDPSATPYRIVEIDEGFRRDIVDRNRQLVATNLRTETLYADAREILDANEAARALITIFPEFNFQALAQKLSSRRAYVVLRHGLTPVQQATVHALGIPGFHFRSHQTRIYPKGPLASHLVGFVGTENNGLIGLEKSIDETLTSAETKGPIELSIDLRVQYIMRDELRSAMLEFKAKAASGIIMDVNTGEILSLVSLPDFDPNDMDAATDNQKFNRATLGVYEMGSTFKAFNTAMALDSGKVNLSDRFDASTPYRVANRTIRDHHPENRWLSVSEVFMVSSNIGSARIAHHVGVTEQTEFLSRIGLFERPQIQLPEVSRPLLPIKWGPTETATVSYGHGISVSPLSVSVAMASLINGGYKITPSLIRMKDYDLQSRERVVSDTTSRQMRRLMRLVVTDGTGGKADVPGYSVGGKTGTADIPQAGTYNRSKVMTSFAGIFPAHDPKYLVLAVLEEPKGIVKTHMLRGAGWNAAPTVGAIIARAAPALGVRPNAEVSPFVEAARSSAQTAAKRAEQAMAQVGIGKDE